MKIRSGCEGGGKGSLIQKNKSATLSCNNDQTLFEPCGWDGGQISPTLTQQNAGGNQRMPDKDNFTCVLQPFGICSKDSNSMKSDNPHSGIYKAENARTIDANGGNPSCNQGGIAVVAFTQNQREELQPTLVAKGPGAIQSGYTVRRLTPTECARLQGFADRWGEIDEKTSFTPEEYEFWLNVRNTHAAINGKKTQNYTEKQMLTWYNKLHTDSAEYKMWGNGIALPPALYCMQGIVEAM